MNLSVPRSLWARPAVPERGSGSGPGPGPGPGLTAAARRAERGREREAGVAFTGWLVEVREGKAPLPSHSFPKPPLPRPLRPQCVPVNRTCCRGAGHKGGSQFASPPAPALPFAPQQPRRAPCCLPGPRSPGWRRRVGRAAVPLPRCPPAAGPHGGSLGLFW